MDFGQIVAFVMVNKCVKYHNISFKRVEVMAKGKRGFFTTMTTTTTTMQITTPG
jgi:hypothetical protein